MPGEEQQSKSGLSRLSKELFALVVILAVGSAIWWYAAHERSATAPPRSATDVLKSSDDLYSALLKRDADFAAGMSARAKGNRAAAEVSLQKAYDAEQDHDARGVIAYWLADAQAANGEYDKAIANLKSLAGDSGYAPPARAYAIQAMGRFYYHYRDPEITALIFQGSPYANMRVASDAPLSYRHLFEYASSLSPLPLSEFYIATWYADYALAQGATASSSIAVARDIDQTRRHAENAQARIGAIEAAKVNDPTFLATILQRAIVIGKMSLLNVSGFGDPDAEFGKLLDGYAKAGNRADGAVRIQYAIFLAQKYGSSRSSGIGKVLAPLVADPKTHFRSLSAIAPRIRDLKNSETKKSYALLASLDPDFKKLLSSYGWTAHDFAQK